MKSPVCLTQVHERNYNPYDTDNVLPLYWHTDSHASALSSMCC